MAGVVLSGVRKAFGGFVAVHGLDLEIGEREFVSLLGPSGCGKTTTLRMLAGLEFPSEGEISIGGRVVNHVPPGKRNIAMVFQSYALYPHMTVGRNIAYPLKKRGVPPAERTRLVAETAELLQLTELLGRKPRQLSGGQQQRVALGRALVRDPDVFLLDEPLSNLDAKLRSYMRAELVELHRRLGRTMVYVTHDQLEAMTMSDRIAVMSGGHLQQFATPHDVYNRPLNRFVAGFIGTPSMNMIDGALRRENSGRVLFETPGLTVSVPGLANSIHGPATLGARPEHVLIGEGTMNATVRIVEPTGHENIVIVELERGPKLTARTPASARIAVGEIVPIGLASDQLHVFAGDAEGRRLNADADVESQSAAADTRRTARN